MIRVVASKQYRHGTTTLRFVLCHMSDTDFQASVFILEHEVAVDSVVEVIDVCAPEAAARTVHLDQYNVWAALLRTQPGTTGRAAVAAVLRDISKMRGADLPQRGIMTVAQHKSRMRRLSSVL